MDKLKILAGAFLVGIVGGSVVWSLNQWAVNLIKKPASAPTIYTLQFGVTVNKFMVINNRLHLLVPLPVTGESGKIVEIDKVSKQGREGK